jgi:chemotaxis protein MotB
MAGDGPPVIKRIKKSGGEGHHGGAWKVAYADFVTAMMAFFLLMWLINTTTPEQKRGIADYFAAQNISKSSSGSGGVLAGTVFGAEGSRAGGALTSMTAQQAPSRRDNPTRTTTEGELKSGATDAQMPNREFEHAEISLRQAMQQMPDIAELSRNLIVNETAEGLNIQLVDQEGQAMFQPGTAVPLPRTRALLEQVARIVDRLPNRISITGHTDAVNFEGPDGTTNWELSAARANAARSVLASHGIASDRIFEVAGKAGTDPLLPNDPYASSNRRISILLMREAPVVPPGYRL